MRDVPLKWTECIQRFQGETLAQARVMFQFRPPSSREVGSVTRTLRLDQDVDTTMAEMAEREGLSVNLLANRALRKFVEWEAKAEKFGFVHLPVSTLEKLFNTLSNEEARELGKSAGQNLLPELVHFWFKRLDRNTALKTMELIAEYGKSFRFEQTTGNHSDVVVLRHGRGPMVSAYYAELLRSLFESLGTMVETSETQDQVVANLIHPSLNSIAKPD